MKIFSTGKIYIQSVDSLCDSYKTDTGCVILVSKEGNEKIKRYHLSISHADRYPTWDEIKQARYDLLSKDKEFAMIFPKEQDYVNIHPNCFHLWEIKEGELE